MAGKRRKVDTIKHLVEQLKEEIEKDLKHYRGDDPLSIWLPYIKSVEDKLDNPDFEELLMSCINYFTDQTRYKEDRRFLEVLLKYSRIASYPITLFFKINKKKLFQSHAEFYKNWSLVLENFNHIQEVKDVLELGFKNAAEPEYMLIDSINLLKSQHDEIDEKPVVEQNKPRHSTEIIEIDCDSEHQSEAPDKKKVLKKSDLAVSEDDSSKITKLKKIHAIKDLLVPLYGCDEILSSHITNTINMNGKIQWFVGEKERAYLESKLSGSHGKYSCPSNTDLIVVQTPLSLEMNKEATHLDSVENQEVNLHNSDRLDSRMTKLERDMGELKKQLNFFFNGSQNN